ncbi:hypothetical protein [Marivita hallyeonensis]|uniref:Transferrin-binding protein B C-lobe/N-lobe beta barrel domain-containing protein n=1 Tax=Marivita hallyeonensis TaxID=996342 RepID=A0A1M5XYF3_9RHOB|nr:hypothetical protein [Marivita hallyeonensis]SHI04820.1 hypothetical protein SAMN05443551_4214 [Marivita hallyeonensis]
MTRILFLILCFGFVAACDSGGGDVLNPPVEEDPDTDTPTDGETDPDATPIDSDRELPPGTAEPTPDSSIVRTEERTDDGGGFAENVRYLNDQGQDQFVVDNLAFDGDNVYERGTAVSQLAGFGVYEGAESTVDPDTGNVLGTFQYRAVYGRSRTGQTEFAIVRTGSYIDYGFGGFVYQRNSTDFNGDPVRLVLPEDGDAQYVGEYAGIRIFDGQSGLEYVSGEAELFLDFKDFNNGQRGVALFVRDRRLFDVNGNDITNDYLAAIGADNGGASGDGAPSRNLIILTDDAGNPVLPNLASIVSPTNADTNGEITGDIAERARFDDGSIVTTAEGTYFGIVSGTDASEIVGVLVIEGGDPRNDSTVQESGGFIIYRQ